MTKLRQKVIIITINYNLSSETISCVKSILASDYEDLLIYLIDNGSEPQDYNSLIDSFGSNSKVRILRIEKNCGYVGGVNYGLKKVLKTDSDYIIIMNNDTIIDKVAISYLVESARINSDKAIVSGKVYYYDHPDILQHTGVIFTDSRFLTTKYPGRDERDIGQFEAELERDSLDDVFWLLPVSLVKDVGYYCDYFFLYAEQGDYAQRARRKGYKLIFTPKAKIWHKVSMTTGAGSKNALPICYWRGQGLFVFQFRNLKTKYFIVTMVKRFLKLSAMALLMRGDERRCSYARLRGYFWGFRWLFNKRPNDGYNPYIKISLK